MPPAAVGPSTRRPAGSGEPGRRKFSADPGVREGRSVIPRQLPRGGRSDTRSARRRSCEPGDGRPPPGEASEPAAEQCLERSLSSGTRPSCSRARAPSWPRSDGRRQGCSRDTGRTAGKVGRKRSISAVKASGRSTVTARGTRLPRERSGKQRRSRTRRSPQRRRGPVRPVGSHPRLATTRQPPIASAKATLSTTARGARRGPARERRGFASRRARRSAAVYRSQSGGASVVSASAGRGSGWPRDSAARPTQRCASRLPAARTRASRAASSRFAGRLARCNGDQALVRRVHVGSPRHVGSPPPGPGASLRTSPVEGLSLAASARSPSRTRRAVIAAWNTSSSSRAERHPTRPEPRLIGSRGAKDEARDGQERQRPERAWSTAVPR
jgi:hypothetical protein